MPKFIAPLLVALIAAPGAFAEGAPQSIPLTLTPPKTNVTIRSITLDAATDDVTPEGQKVLDQMIDEGWRAMSVTSIAPHKLAVMFAKAARPPSPPPMPPPQPQQPGIQHQPLPMPPVQPPGPPPPPMREHNP